MARCMDDLYSQRTNVQCIPVVEQDIGAVFPMQAKEKELAVLAVDHLFLVLMHIDLCIFKQAHGAGMVRVGMSEKNRGHLPRLNSQLAHFRKEIVLAHTRVDHHVALACFEKVRIHEFVFHAKNRIVDLLCFRGSHALCFMPYFQKETAGQENQDSKENQKSVKDPFYRLFHNWI